MRKIERELRAIAQAQGYDVTVGHRGNSHYKVTVERHGRSKTLTVSASPRSLDVTLKNFVADIRRYWR